MAMMAIGAGATPGMARADATQPAVARPEIGQDRTDRGPYDMVPIRVGSDESLFGGNGSDGIR